MTQPKVFLLQHPMRQKTPLDISDAARYGRLQKPIFPSTYNALLDTTDAVNKIEQALLEVAPDDFVVAIGDPALIGIAMMIAGRNTGGQVNLLKWNRALDRDGNRVRTQGNYVPVEISVDLD